jgi:hypothetical protein
VEIVGTPPASPSEEQSFALLTEEEARRLRRTGDGRRQLGGQRHPAGDVLNRTHTEAQMQPEQGMLLSQSVSVDFGSPEDPPGAHVARGLQDSMSHLQRASSRATTLSQPDWAPV